MPKAACQVLVSALSDSTRTSYATRVTRISTETGAAEPSLFDLERFILAHCPESESPLRATTLRGYKSALIFVFEVAGRSVPAAAARRLDRLLDGMEASERPNKPRGKMTYAKVMALAGWLREKGHGCYADGYIIAFGAALRGGDLRRLTRDKVDLDDRIVYAWRKATKLERRRSGNYEARPIATEGAYAVLRRLCRGKAAQDHIPPDWRDNRASELCREAAVEIKWPSVCEWDGAHTARHGAAAEAFETAMAAVKCRGGWKTQKSARRYSGY